MRSLSATLVGTLILLSTFQAKAQDYQFHHIFIYQFTKYIQWPSSYQSGDFLIAVVGQSELVPYLENMATMKSVGTQKINVEVVNSIIGLEKPNMVYVPAQRMNQMPDVKDQLQARPTVIITEVQGGLEKGSDINFIEVDGRIKFEINREKLEEKGLKISTELLKFAVR